ncbi:PrsW family glutamic-type intramembrane protease [Candidatus Absconditicoccus praedator]|uniref:PrsW family glutamic-type intramembrane protease n=1 Tax=Candidatus Absconditicoccus praedator TaxID=2735562 RepID=UPI001E48C9F6|nr:PrsW family glutamic-type intramembrane protease [Candidatus Absconditicoccus praedator]UFX83186.1 PrsW family intramembrane metalloprotease [Candidatus Absconditicoccus praedator]
MKLIKTDIIAFSILSGIGFAFFENIVYLISSIKGEDFLVAITGGISLLIARGLIGFLMHIIFTGSIGTIQSFYNNKKNMLIFLSLGVFTGVSLHYTYDILLSKGFGFVIIIFLILGYFYSTFLFYKSDRLYI